MKRYREYEEIFMKGAPAPLDREYQYFAYKGGEVLGPFGSHAEACRAAKIVEQVWVNKAECGANEKARADAQKMAFQAWFVDLRKEYSHLSASLFNLAYSQAYDRGHSDGYDEVANYMIDIVAFIEKVIKAYEA